MILTIKKEVAQKVGYEAFEDYGVRKDHWTTYTSSHSIDLGKLSGDQIDTLEARLARFPNVRGTSVLLADIGAWTQALEEGATNMKARTVRQFETLLRQYLLKANRHHVYQRHDDGAMLCYYANKVEYHPPDRRSERYTPAFVDLELVYEEFGMVCSHHVYFHEENCRNIPVIEALATMGFLVETPDLRAEYEACHVRYVETVSLIGKQYLASGLAEDISGTQSYYRPSTAFILDRDGEPSRVVVDVFREDGTGNRSSLSKAYTNIYFWVNVAKSQSYDLDKDEDPASEDLDLERPEIEIPVHPWICVFHLSKHLRLKVHIAGLEEYVYDVHLADKLILPPKQKGIVKLLIDTSGQVFRDVIKGKGDGAVILLSGAPGTGKTLTAEVYAEAEQRPLYSVQCSQLGTSPDKLEEALLRVFDRAKRWNAVMLLDEADVYIHKRGDSMLQNAVVGVFLRVLEYQNTILFLTTNRPDDVDDAIASRCIAKIDYESPNPEDALKIWAMLADNSNLGVATDTLKLAVDRYPEMTGRDIKMTLKLASKMVGFDEEIMIENIEFAKQFKPA